ncbi:MAG: LamB/YcsF family protein [Rhodobacteraceae bacterium]|nr:LamB/YcsF family protein [Paracoccaceae bacterium]
MRQIDLNADLGEAAGDDAAMLDLVSSANVCCGVHAGSREETFATLAAARARGVVAGAHPGYDDREGFGRRVVPMAPGQIERLVAWQVGACCGLAALAGHRIGYVKAHGALYNLAATDREVAAAIARAVRAVDPGLVVLALAGSVAIAAAEEAGLATAAEAFADRGYLSDGTLAPRGTAGAVLTDPDLVAGRALEMAETRSLPGGAGGGAGLRIDSLCLHGDTPGAVGLARAVRARLTGAGFRIAPFAPAAP